MKERSRESPRETALKLGATASPGRVRSEREPCLILLSQSAGDAIFPLLPGEHVLIGRAEEADFPVQAKGVSRHHAEVFERGGAWFIRDLNSTNGTQVNGVPVRERKLEFGDRIELGRAVTLHFTEQHFEELPTRRKRMTPRPE